MEYSRVESRFDATELANHLKSPHRHKPVVVVSSTKQGPRISPTAITDRVEGIAEVFLLTTAKVTYDLEELLPADLHVYGGAARSYPPGTAWMKKMQVCPVRLAYTDEEAALAVELIGSDVDAMVQISPAAPAPAAALPAARKTTVGTVTMLMAEGAVVRRDDAEQGRAITRIDTESFAPGISPELLLSVGMKVHGTLSGGVLNISPMLNTPADAADYAEEATIQAALVLDEKTVALFPGLNIRHRTDGIPAGTVIAVEIELSGRADGKAWRLVTADDVGPDEVSEALPLFRGGSPWISLPEEPERVAPPALPVEPAKPAEVDAFTAWEIVRTELEKLAEQNAALSTENDDLRSASPAPAEPVMPVAGPVPVAVFGGVELERANQEIARLDRVRRELLAATQRAGRDADTMARENASLVQQVARLREDVRSERARATLARQTTRTDPAPERESLFLDPQEQFRFDVLQEWATRIPATSKADLPLPDYGIGPDFLDSVQSLHGVDRSKIVAVAVEVLTGLAERSPGREMHLMRAGNPSLVPPAGVGQCTAWRVSLQVGSASARRMHFWRGTGGRITLANVGVHDEIIG